MVESDQDLHWPLSQSLDITECIKVDQRPRWYLWVHRMIWICAFCECLKAHIGINSQAIEKQYLKQYLKLTTQDNLKTRGSWWPCSTHLSIIALREPDLELIKANILTKLSFEVDLEIKTNILSEIHDDCLKNMISRVLTIFSFDLNWWPSFWVQVTQFQSWPRFHWGKHSEQVSSRLGKNCGL